MKAKYLIHIIILAFSCVLFTSNASAVAFNDWGRWASGVQKTGPSGCDVDNSGDACNQDETLLERDILEDDAADTIYALALFFDGLDEFVENEEELEEFLDFLRFIVIGDEFSDFGILELVAEIIGFFGGGFEFEESEFDISGFIAFLIDEGFVGFDTEKGTFTFEELELGEEEFLVELLLAFFEAGFTSGDHATGPLALVDLFAASAEEIDGAEGIEENAVFLPLGGGEYHTIGLFAFVENNAIGIGPFVEGTPTDNMSDLMAGEVSAFYEGEGFGIGTEGLAFWEFEMAVFFGDEEWEGAFYSGGEESGCAVCEFGAAGDISGADFFSTDIFSEGEGDVTGFVEGTFFGPDAQELGGRFEVSNFDGESGGTDMAVFSGFQEEGPCRECD